MKDEFDYDNQQSHSSSESHLQTIQHPPSRAVPPETFSSPALLPPSDGSSSASTSAFSAISAGPSSEMLHKLNSFVVHLTLCRTKFLQSMKYLFFISAFANTYLFIYFLLFQILPQTGAEMAAFLQRCLNTRMGTYSIIHPCLTRDITVSRLTASNS